VNKSRAPRNRTITISEEERANFAENLARLSKKSSVTNITDRIINQNLFKIIVFLQTVSPGKETL